MTEMNECTNEVEITESLNLGTVLVVMWVFPESVSVSVSSGAEMTFTPTSAPVKL